MIVEFHCHRFAGHHVRHSILERLDPGRETNAINDRAKDSLLRPGRQHRVQVQGQGQHQERLRTLEHHRIV